MTATATATMATAMTLRNYFQPHASPDATTGYTPLEVAELYGFPAGDGAGVTVGIVELGGGYDLATEMAYFASLGVNFTGTITDVSVDGGTNQPGSTDGASGEVILDLEIIASLCPAATIRMYFAQNTNQGFQDAVAQACSECDFVSISWGGPENTWSTTDMQAMALTIQSAAQAGKIICVASGDSGSGDGERGLHVDFPASAPWSWACGGSSIQTSGGKITSEVVWDDSRQSSTGGGVSDVFALESWQDGLELSHANREFKLDKRGVPDCAMVADPNTGWKVSFGVVGGTSCAAPGWTALLIRLGMKGEGATLAKEFYTYTSAGVFNPITKGDNGIWAASPSAPKDWSGCCGLGSPNGAALAAL